MVQSNLLTSMTPNSTQQVKNLFSENFWGEKINGFDVLCQNLKHSLISVKDLESFLRESANCEDAYIKVLNKLTTQISRFSPNGSFNPLWAPLKELNEKYSAKHSEQLHHLHELIKEIQRYNEDLGKKIKKIREGELQTQTCVQNFQEIHTTLNKTKEQYHNLCIEFDKQKRQLDPQQLAQYQQQISSTNLLALSNSNSNANGMGSSNPGSSSPQIPGLLIQSSTINGQPNVPPVTTAPAATTSDRLSSLASSISVSKVSQVQKLEKKLRQAFEDYKLSIDKYNVIREEYDRRLAESCHNFQFAEETHLKQMRVFIESYSILLSNINLAKSQIYNDFQSKFEQYTSDYLLQIFIENKRTGVERPEVAVFVDKFDYGETTNILSNRNPTASPNNLINETDFNLFVNGGNFTNTSLNALTPSSMVGTNNQTQSSLSNQASQSLQLNTNDLIDGKGGDYSSSRGTPIFFNGPSNGPYSPLTNVTSTNSALNSIPPNVALNPMMIASSSLVTSAASSPVSNISQSFTPNTSLVNNTAPTPPVVENMKRSDSKGINIFNVDFLGRNKNKEKKAAQKAALAAASLANTNEIQKSNKSGKSNKKANTSNNKNKSSVTSNNNSQYENLNSSNSTFLNGGLSISNTSNKDSSSINSEDSNEHRQINTTDQSANNSNNNNLAINMGSVINTTDQQGSVNNTNNNTNNGSISARSIGSINGSLSFDLLDQLKLSNGSDIDSEGYSIRPDSSIGMRRKNRDPLRNKDNDDMNNLYASSSTDSDSDDSDSENNNSMGGPVKVMLKIKPKSETDKPMSNNADVLREISKNLQLKPTLGNSSSQLNNNKNVKKRTYYYNYGTANPDQATSGYSTSNISENQCSLDLSKNENTSALGISNASMTRSCSVGSVVSGSNFLTDFNSFNSNNSSQPTPAKPATNSVLNNNESLLDFGLNFASNNKKTPPTIPLPATKTPGEITNLYNIDEDKEVESSFQYDQATNYSKRNNNVSSSSPATNALANLSNTNGNNSQAFNTGNTSVTNGRFTPACFPGRTTPDFRHTTSIFEQQGIRASIVSPLTINSGSEIIPIAVAFNETVHAYFKMGDQAKFKVKCFGCMKISFPFAILKLLAIELPQLEFRLSNLHIANQDLKINNQLLNRTSADSSNQSFVSAVSSASSPPQLNNSSTSSSSINSLTESLQFQFVTQNLITELKQQHQQNKMAAFFNFELLKYEFKYSNTPLVLNARWTSNPDESTIELTLDYVFNFRKNLSQVNFMIVMPINKSNEKISLVKSEPTAMVQETENKLQILWQLSSINSNGKIKAKFSIVSKESSNISLEKFYQPVYAKFHVDNETLSQVKFDILSSSYKLSLLKEKIESGKYFCNNDQSNSTNNASNNNEQSQNTSGSKRAAFAGNISTTIGSSVDILP